MTTTTTTTTESINNYLMIVHWKCMRRIIIYKQSGSRKCAQWYAASSATSLIGFFIVLCVYISNAFFLYIYTRFFNINNGGILFNGNRLKYILQPLYIHISDKSRARVVNIFRLYIFLRAQPIFLGFGFGWAAQLQRIASASAEQSTTFVRSIYGIWN